ncbi:MAG: MATE family efflux transporter [Clostridiales bacterium]|nr:MATE family efflux transporter [Clostridiales bacterium]
MLKKFIALFGAQDMTVGKPFVCLLKFSVPLLIGNIAQMLYSTVDAIIVGEYIGDAALSAVGVSTPIQHLFLVFFMAVGSAVTVMVAQYFGARDYDHLGDTIGNSITLIAVISVVITAVATPLTGSLLRLMNTPPETYDMAVAYLMILFLGAAGNGFYNVLSGILRGLGESVFPLLILLLTVILNTILDIWFVSGLHMGIAGAAWATIISQSISAVLCLIKIMRIRSIVKIKPKMLLLKRRIVGHIVRLGIPTSLQMGIMSLSTMLVQSLVNSMGFLVTTTITALMRIDGFAVLPSHTFSISASTYTGQNTGAGNMERVRQGTRTVFYMCLVFTVVMVAAMLLFGRSMFSLFTDTPAVIDMGMGFIRIMAFAYIAMVFNNVFSGVMRGAGDSMGPMWISVGVNVVLRVPLAYVIAYFTRSLAYPAGNPDSIFWSLLAAMVAGAVVTIIYFRKGRWRNKSIINPNLEVPDAEATV